MKKFAFIIAIALLMFFIGFRECQHYKQTGRSSKNDTIFIVDTIPGDSVPYAVEIVKKVPVPVYVDTGSVHWREMEIDTMAILADYFVKYHYDDTLMNDTSAFIRLQSHTFENKLFYDKLLFQNRRIKTINTTIIPPTPERNKWYIGIAPSLGADKPGLAGSLLITFPAGIGFAGHYDFVNEYYLFSGYYKIRFGRK